VGGGGFGECRFGRGLGGALFLRRFGGGHGLARFGPVAVFALEGEDEVVDGVGEAEDGEVGLEPEAEPGGVGSGQLFGGDRGDFPLVEGDDLGPLEAGEIGGERGVGRGQAAVGGTEEEGLEPAAQIAQGEGMGGMGGEVGAGEALEFSFAERRRQGGEIVPQ